MSVKTVGYIGLGKAGASMASNLPRAGFRLIVRDADPAREQKFAQENSNTSVAEAGADGFKDCDVVVTMLPQGKVVREVVLGENGIARGLRPGMRSLPERTRRELSSTMHEHSLLKAEAQETLVRPH